jgi:hypothetical protein
VWLGLYRYHRVCFSAEVGTPCWQLAID